MDSGWCTAAGGWRTSVPANLIAPEARSKMQPMSSTPTSAAVPWNCPCGQKLSGLGCHAYFFSFPFIIIAIVLPDYLIFRSQPFIQYHIKFAHVCLHNSKLDTSDGF